MVFGFNTDVAHDGTIYHVQSEMRSGALESQVFIRGQCVGKHTVECADLPEQQLHESLKAQHRQVLEAVRSGKLKELLQRASGGGMTIQWLSAEPQPETGLLVMRFALTSRDAPVAGARILGRLELADRPFAYAEANTAPEGGFELRFRFDHSAPPEEGTIVVRAANAGASITQRFRLRRA